MDENSTPRIDIMLESNPLKSSISVQRLAVGGRGAGSFCRHFLRSSTVPCRPTPSSCALLTNGGREAFGFPPRIPYTLKSLMKGNPLYMGIPYIVKSLIQGVPTVSHLRFMDLRGSHRGLKRRQLEAATGVQA